MSDQIVHLKQSLFNAPKGSVIVHACNAKGVWGRGIAKEFKERYPDSFKRYNFWCTELYSPGTDDSALGTASISCMVEEPHGVGWIVTSEGYAESTDSKELIKINTTLALIQFCENVMGHFAAGAEFDVYSNKFNSGLFSVPWEESELILKTVLQKYPKIKWYVCSSEEK